METEDRAIRPKAFETIVYGGLAIGVLDFLDASIFFTTYYGIGLERVWHGVSAGVLGREAAAAGGWNSAALGIFLHFVVSFGVAAVYYLLSLSIPILLRHPIVSGMVFGVAAHFVMQFVVVPLSAIGWRSAPFDPGVFLNSILGHAFLVGLPVALIAAWSARRSGNS